MGYKWPGMDKLGWEEVVELHQKGELAGCYLLYPDDTEGCIENDYTWEEIVWHHEGGGEFGLENDKKGVMVGRHIEGITINPLEYVLDENGDVKLFPNEEDAKGFLKEKGFMDDEIYWLVFEKLGMDNE